MANSLTKRVSRIITGSAHALIDRAENLAPEAVMAQSIREIEQVITEVRADLGKAEAAKHLVFNQISKLNSEHETLAEQLQTAVTLNHDELARVAIGRQADIEDLLPVLQKSLDEHVEHATELESYIVALYAKKRELEQTLNDYQILQQTQNASPEAQGGSDRQGRVEQAESSFSRILSRHAGMNLTQGLNAQAGKLKELADMQRNQRITERLAALKAAKEN